MECGVQERGETVRGWGLSDPRVVVVVEDQFIHPAVYRPKWIMAATGPPSYMTIILSPTGIIPPSLRCPAVKVWLPVSCSQTSQRRRKRTKENKNIQGVPASLPPLRRHLYRRSGEAATIRPTFVFRRKDSIATLTVNKSNELKVGIQQRRREYRARPL